MIKDLNILTFDTFLKQIKLLIIYRKSIIEKWCQSQSNKRLSPVIYFHNRQHFVSVISLNISH